MNLPTASLLFVAALPLALSTVGTVLAARGENRSWLASAAPALGYMAGHAGLRGLPGFPPHDVTDWLFHFALMAAFADVVEQRLPRTKAVDAGTRFGRLLMSALLAFLLFGPVIEHRLSAASAALAVSAATVLLLLMWSGVAALRQETGTNLALATSATLAAGTQLLSGSLVLGQLTGALAAALGGLFLVSLKKPLAAPHGAVAALPLGGLLLVGFLYSELSPIGAALLAGAPLLPRLALTVPKISRLEGAPRALALTAASALPAAAALALAAYESLQAADGYY